ncbi:MAG TPA: thioesterase domain-containing protein, partial [Chthoniobacterales bacterium]
AVLDREALRDFARRHLPDYMVPSAWVVLPQFPLTPNGKVDRRALPEPARSVAAVMVPPRTALETRLAAIWEKVLQVEPVGVTANFFELGGSSLAAVRVFAEIKKDLGKNLPMATLFTRPTVEELASLLKEEAPEQEWTTIVPIQLQGTRPPFFGVHAGLGNVLFYRELAHLLGHEQPFYGIQAQGLDGKPIVRTSVETIAEYYWQEMRKVQPTGPYLLGGYSFGGVVAYEMARLIRAAGEEVALLALFDTGNPARPPRLRSYAERLRNAFQDREALSPYRIMHFLAGRTRGRLGDRLLRWSELYRNLAAKWRKGGDNKAVAEEQVNLAVITTHERAALAYRPLPYDGKLTLLRAATQEEGYITEPDLGWGPLVHGGMEVHEVPGTHWDLFSAENVRSLAEVLLACMRAALAGSPAPAAPSDPPHPKGTFPWQPREVVGLASQNRRG